MNTITQKAIDKAIGILEAVKADFCVKHNGQTYGNLKAEPEKIKRKFLFRHVDEYKDVLNQMKPGDTHKWTFETAKAESFRSSLTGAASQKWGNDTYMTAITKESSGLSVVEILRIS